MPEILKSSAEWQETYPYVVLDPDGWDRKNFDASWSELISFEEFDNRATLSTVSYDPEFEDR